MPKAFLNSARLLVVVIVMFIICGCLDNRNEDMAGHKNTVIIYMENKSAIAAYAKNEIGDYCGRMFSDQISFQFQSEHFDIG
jgi:hypothetical protein